MDNLQRASDPSLTPKEFKELLDLEDEFVYEALDLNDIAATRYIDYLSNFPDPEYFPHELITEEEARQLAAENNHLGQYELGDLAFKQGDVETARRWFLAASENGNIVCMLNFARLTEDLSERRKWLKKSALKGLPNAQRELGRDYWAEGDTTRALLWFGCASRRGLAAAFSDLGALHWELENEEEALANWRIAAEAGDEYAATNLQNFDSGSIFDDDFESDESTTFTPAFTGYVSDLMPNEEAPSTQTKRLK